MGCRALLQGNFLNPEFMPLMFPELAGGFFTTRATCETYVYVYMCVCVCVYTFRFFSLIGYYKILNIVSCAIQ